MTSAVSRKDPAGDLRRALIEALVRIPVTNSLTDRRLLISLIKRDVANFPDVQERPEARLHIVQLVMACLEYPASLRALSAALNVMSPDEPATRRTLEIITNASLMSLLREDEIRRLHDLLQRALVRPELPDWRTLVDGVAPQITDQAGGLISAFDHLAARGRDADGFPPALRLVARVVAGLDGPLRVEVAAWLQEQIDRLGLPEEVFLSDDAEPTGTPIDESKGRSESGGPGHEPVPPGANLPDEKTDKSDPYPDRSVEADDEPGYESGDIQMLSVASARRQLSKLPQVWGDVPPRNPNFTGRDALLQQLHSDLRAGRETAVLPQALHGMGGVGKSQVAIEYVHRHSRDFDLVWWIPAEQPGQILSSVTKLAQRLGLEASPEANSAVPAVREALSTGSIPYANWLLVFDNAESLQDVRSYFPTGGDGKILVTSRNPEWAAVARALEVDVFTREESKTFLVGRTPQLSDHDANRLAEALGDLPLAVEQAAAWHAATGMPVDDYLRLLDEKRIELLDDTSSPDYQVSVAAAWNVSLDKLEQVNLAALQLLQVCSYFAPEPISREFFAGSPISPVTEALDETLRDPIKLGRAIRDIQRYALARFDHRNNTLQMHRLVQAVLVGRMDERQREIMRIGSHTLLASANPHSPARRSRWDRYQSLLPHVIVSRAVESEDPNVQELVYEIVEFLYHWGDHTGCLDFAEEAYKHRLRLLGESNPQTLRLAKYVGFIRGVLAQFASAAEILERSLELYLERFGEEDEGTLDAMIMVAYSRRTRGEFAEARKLNDRAFEICRRAFGPDDPVTLFAAHSLGVSLRHLAEFTAARDRDAETFRRRQDVLGSGDSETLRTLNDLNLDLREAGDFVRARTQQEEAYQRFLEEFGQDNPVVMRAALHLAVARRKAGDHPGALALAKETLDKFRRRYGEDYPETMETALNLAIDMRHAGDLEGSLSLTELTVKRYRKIFGDQHPHTMAARINLAVVLRLLGDIKAAHETNRTTLETLLARLGPEHATTLACATNLASDMSALGEAKAAFDMDTDTMAKSERTLGVEHPSTLAVGVNLALDLRGLGREQEANLLHADTMARFRRSLGNEHPATLNALKSGRADADVDPMPL